MNFPLTWYSPPGNDTDNVECIVISQSKHLAIVIPCLSASEGRIIKDVYHLEVETTNASTPEYYDLSQIDTVDTNRVSTITRDSLTTGSAKRLDFFLRSLLAPQISADQSINCGRIAMHKFDNSANLHTYNKERPVLIIKVWKNGMALVLPITSSKSDNDYRQLLRIGRVGPLKKKSSVAIDHWYSVPVHELRYKPHSRLPLLATLLTQARCQSSWSIKDV